MWPFIGGILTGAVFVISMDWITVGQFMLTRYVIVCECGATIKGFTKVKTVKCLCGYETLL